MRRGPTALFLHGCSCRDPHTYWLLNSCQRQPLSLLALVLCGTSDRNLGPTSNAKLCASYHCLRPSKSENHAYAGARSLIMTGEVSRPSYVAWDIRRGRSCASSEPALDVKSRVPAPGQIAHLGRSTQRLLSPISRSLEYEKKPGRARHIKLALY